MEKHSKNTGTLAASPPESQADRNSLPPCPLRVVLGSSQAAGLPANTLACLRYGSDALPTDDPRVVPVGLEPGGEIREELWLSTLPVRTGSSDGLRYAENGSLLFGWLHLDEAALASIERASLRAYVRIDRLLERLGYPHWLRVWNFLAHINAGEDDSERYRQFVAGRHHALALKPGFERQLPAATAIGTRGQGLTICFLAGRHAGIQVENPRQLSAFHYPRHYGPKSPSFSRATLQHWRDRSLLFLSGTSSVVGHASLHAGDAAAQLDETLVNIEALLAHAAQRHFSSRGVNATAEGFKPEEFKVYVRAPAHIAPLAARLQSSFAGRAPSLVLLGDICRRDLLIEVEALYSWPHAEDLA